MLWKKTMRRMSSSNNAHFTPVRQSTHPYKVIKGLLLLPPTNTTRKPTQTQTRPRLMPLSLPLPTSRRRRRPHRTRRTPRPTRPSTLRLHSRRPHALLLLLLIDRQILAQTRQSLTPPRLLLRRFEPVQQLRPLDLTLLLPWLESHANAIARLAEIASGRARRRAAATRRTDF